MVRTGAGGQRVSGWGLQAARRLPGLPLTLGRALFLPDSSAGPLGSQTLRTPWRPGHAVPVPRGLNSIHRCHGDRNLLTQVCIRAVREQRPGWTQSGISELAPGRPGLVSSGLRNVHRETSSLSLRTAVFLPPAVDRPRPSRGAPPSPTTASWRLHQPPLLPARLGQAPQHGHSAVWGAGQSPTLSTSPVGTPGQLRRSHRAAGPYSTGSAWPPVCPPEPSTSPGAVPAEQRVQSMEHGPRP